MKKVNSRTYTAAFVWVFGTYLVSYRRAFLTSFWTRQKPHSTLLSSNTEKQFEDVRGGAFLRKHKLAVTKWKHKMTVSANLCFKGHVGLSWMGMAEAHGNRTHRGNFSSPPPVLKTGRPTSDRRASRQGRYLQLQESSPYLLTFW